MTTSYFPSTESARINWAIHYRDMIAVHGPTMGISAAEITATQTDLNFYVWLLHDWYPTLQADAKAATAYKSFITSGEGTIPQPPPPHTPIADAPSVPVPGILTRVFAQIARFKKTAEYNDYIGKELGVIAFPDTTEHPWPEFSLSFEQGPEEGRVSISFTKYGHDGVWIESRVNGGDWVALGADNSKPHYDTRPLLDPALPEVREYRLRWWDKGEPNGEFSPIQKILLGG